MNAKAIARQILTETVKIMSVIHPKNTYSYFADLLDLKVDEFARQEEFSAFVTPAEARKQKELDMAAGKTAKPNFFNETMFHYFSVSQREKNKRKSDFKDVRLPSVKKLKQQTLQFSHSS